MGGVLIGFYGISKHHFLRGAVSLSSIIYVHCSTVDGGADQIWIAVVVRGGVVKIFDFAEVINEWPLNGRIIETCVRIWSF